MAKKKDLSGRVRDLETRETVTCGMGYGPPAATRRGAVLEFYFDRANQELWFCIGGTNWKRVATD